VWVNRGRRGWILPLVSLLAVPPLLIVAGFVAAFMLAWAAVLA
jgi:hypothetical protein